MKASVMGLFASYANWFKNISMLKNYIKSRRFLWNSSHVIWSRCRRQRSKTLNNWKRATGEEVKWQENFFFWFFSSIVLIPFVIVLRSILQNFRLYKEQKTKNFLSFLVLQWKCCKGKCRHKLKSEKLQLQMENENSRVRQRLYRCQQKIIRV